MTNRRQIIAGLAIVPALAAPALAGTVIGMGTPSIPAVDRTAWDSGMLTYARSLAAYQRFERETYRPLADKPTPMRPGSFGAVSKELDRLCAAWCDAEAAQMCTPAPDASAFIWKLERLLDGDGEWTNGAAEIALADAHRLFGEG